MLGAGEPASFWCAVRTGGDSAVSVRAASYAPTRPPPGVGEKNGLRGRSRCQVTLSRLVSSSISAHGWSCSQYHWNRPT